MFGLLKKRKKENSRAVRETEEESEKDRQSSYQKIAAGSVIVDSAQESVEQAARTFEKPTQYTGNRNLYDDGIAKRNIKQRDFSSGSTVRDPYTNEQLELRKKDAKLKYGDDWQNHLAEADHITPLEQVFEIGKQEPFLSNDEIRKFANSDDNLETVSRKYNNAKRSRTNSEFVTDEEYLRKTGVDLSEKGKQTAITRGEQAEKAIRKKMKKANAKNAIETGHNAGKDAAGIAGATVATMSGIMNIVAVIRGDKSPDEAVADFAFDTGKAAATGYVMGGGLTTISYQLSNSSSKFLRGLSASRVPDNVLNLIMVTGDVLRCYAKGEISTCECILALGERGLNYATVGYSMAVGQALIPIPIIGAAIGALVGSVATSECYRELIRILETKQLEHEERLRIIAECEQMAREAKMFRVELEGYLEQYFSDYKDCFDGAFSEIQQGFQTNCPDKVIAGANRVTRKLGGNVYYENVEEFKVFLMMDSVDIL